jgi:hypothetical protein
MAASTFSRDFNRSTLAKLARKGITPVGVTSILPKGETCWTRAERGYQLNDNGCLRIRSFREVLELAQ